MQEKDLIDIVAITCEADAIGKPGMATEWEWRHGWIHPQTYAEVLYCPPGMILENIPMQLNGMEENVKFGLINLLTKLTPAHWDNWRSLQ